MSSVMLVVDVDDIHERFRRQSVPVSPGTLAQGLRRSARVLGAPLRAVACARWGHDAPSEESGYAIDPLRDAFAEEGYDIVEGGDTREVTREIMLNLMQQQEPGETPAVVVLVTGDSTFVRDVTEVGLAAEVRLWLPPVPDEDLPDSVATLTLEELLDMQTMTVALFIDLENVTISLRNQGYVVDPATIARSFLETAQQYGQIRESYAYADWQRLPPMIDATGRVVTADAQRIFEMHGIETRYLVNVSGKNTADMRIVEHIRDLLEREPPAHFVLATGDRDFLPIITTLCSRGFEVTVWGVDGSTSPALSRVAPVEYIQNFVPLIRRADQPSDHVPSDVVNHAVAPPLDAFEASRPSLWTKLALIADDLLRRNDWKWVSQARLAAELSRFREFGHDETESRVVLSQAMALGVILRERIANPNPNYPDQFTWACRPNSEHIVVAAARLVPARILAILKFHLTRMPYVAFSYLSLGMARDSELTVPWLQLDADGRAQWINFLISEGWIVLSKRPHHRNPSDLVSALTLPTSAQEPTDLVDLRPDSIATVPPAIDSAVQSDEARQHLLDDMRRRMVVSIDSFTTRSQLSWAPVITLRQRLLPFGREEAEYVLRASQASGELEVQEYPNPHRPYPTRGASIRRDAPAIRQILEERDRLILRLVQYRQQLGSVSADLLVIDGMTQQQADLWLSILQQERIVLPERFQPGESPRYSLDLGHPVVQAVLERVDTSFPPTIAVGVMGGHDGALVPEIPLTAQFDHMRDDPQLLPLVMGDSDASG